MLYQITAPHFCAGIYLDKDGVYKSAPIIRYMCRWRLDQIQGYCKRKGWKMDLLAEKEEIDELKKKIISTEKTRRRRA